MKEKHRKAIENDEIIKTLEVLLNGYTNYAQRIKAILDDNPKEQIPDLEGNFYDLPESFKNAEVDVNRFILNVRLEMVRHMVKDIEQGIQHRKNYINGIYNSD